jgi:hypothetical protein
MSTVIDATAAWSSAEGTVTAATQTSVVVVEDACHDVASPARSLRKLLVLGILTF